ncbi:MAG TPA: hypothetical protein DC000_11610 [Clostridiales bacterium]|nr:hypothetical protein [Clostridiales bacterium]
MYNYENKKISDSCGQILKCGEVGQALLFNGTSIGTSVPADIALWAALKCLTHGSFLIQAG